MSAGKRPALKPVSEEMRQVCSLLGEELLRWPGVSERPMFEMRSFYRADVVFAMLPGKRAQRRKLDGLQAGRWNGKVRRPEVEVLRIHECRADEHGARRSR